MSAPLTPAEIAQAGRGAPSGLGPWASEWTDKPHRIVYDLASALETAAAELSALKARRCDGCAHTAPKWRYYPNDGLRCVRLHADVPVDFSCAAWTEKP